MKTRTIGNLTVGKADVAISTPSHTQGVRQGNGKGHLRRAKARANAARSTGINARSRNPIDPRMPNLSPA